MEGIERTLKKRSIVHGGKFQIISKNGERDPRRKNCRDVGKREEKRAEAGSLRDSREDGKGSREFVTYAD